MKEYITVSQKSQAEYIEKRSRFIAQVFPCQNETQAIQIISDTKSQYWDARHNVYAYVLSDGTARFSDDGEPHGTAGKPLLDVVRGSGIVDIVVIVTRYFGGVLLGTGGLVRAYSTSAKDALAAADKVQKCLCTELSVECQYADHSRLLQLIEDSGGIITDTAFTENVQVVFRLKTPGVDRFNDTLCETFSSRLVAKTIKEDYFLFNLEK